MSMISITATLAADIIQQVVMTPVNNEATIFPVSYVVKIIYSSQVLVAHACNLPIRRIAV
jgi:hypothetical protein